MFSHEKMELHNLGKKRIKVCDDAFFDLLHFLHRVDHQHVNLVSRRLCWLSASVECRYPPRAIRTLLVVGTPQSEQSNADCQPAVDQQHRFIGNSISACPAIGAPYAVEFATIAPPANISRISELEICDFIGPQLIQFLRVSASLLDECCLIFDDFENFVQLHSVQFIRQFFALFPANRSVELRFVSSSTAPFFVNHPSLFGCTELSIECTADFPLECLYGWLCQDQFGGDKRKHCLDIRFSTFVHVEKCLDAVQQFVNFIRQRFSCASDRCAFCVEIELLGGPHIPELGTFTEHNEPTGEQLTFTRDNWARLYFLERRRRISKSTEREEEGEGRTDGEGQREANGGDCQNDILQGDISFT